MDHLVLDGSKSFWLGLEFGLVLVVVEHVNDLIPGILGREGRRRAAVRAAHAFVESGMVLSSLLSFALSERQLDLLKIAAI